MRRLLFLPLLVLLLAGCDDGRPKAYPVSGKVVFRDGTSPEFGDIEFFNQATQLNAHGKIQKDGTFTLGTYDVDDGAVEGLHKVIIMQRTRNHFMAHYEGEIKHDHGVLVHKKYFDYRSSRLTATIKAVENNEVTLEVVKMPPREMHDTDH